MIIPFLIPCIIAMFLAINMGGSGTAPSFSAIYGASIIKQSMIPGLFGIAVFIGAIVGGKATAHTLGKSILNPEFMTYPVVSVILFSISISLLIANLLGIPQSTSQSTVMAVTAPAVYFKTLNTHKLYFEILPTWFVMPIIAFVFAYLIGRYIYKPLRKRGYTLLPSINNSMWLKALMVLMSLFVAFSIGTNNVANAVGPMASLTFNILNVSQEYYVHVLILATLIIAPCFGIGSSLFGHNIVKNTGKEIVLFGRVEAVIIAFISASLLLTASLIKGIPTSLVQLNVGAIIGIGVAKLGYKNIFRKTAVNKFFIIWMISPLIAFLLSYFLIYIIDNIDFQLM